MKLKYFLLGAGVVLFTACNNSGKEKEAEKSADTPAVKTGDTAHHDHTATSSANIPELPAVPKNARTFFVNLKNNAEVSSPLKIQMGVSNIKIDTAGPIIPGSGHHHLMIDGPDSLSAGTVVPKDSLNIHFGRGQTETEVILSPGKHKLTLQFADGAHRSYGRKMASSIVVNVKQ